MKVKDVIEELEKFDPELEVYVNSEDGDGVIEESTDVRNIGYGKKRIIVII